MISLSQAPLQMKYYSDLTTSYMAIEEAELLCTSIMLDPGTDVISPPQGPLQIK
jgi:hypothetical protein